MTLRPYQSDLVADVRAEWAAGARNVVMRLDTGGGKTKCLSTIVAEEPAASCVMAHRQEIVSQLSLALAREGVRHRLIAAAATCQVIAAAHVEMFGRSFYEPSSRVAVSSVDTLIRARGLDSWRPQVGLWVVDEGHHLVNGNKWAKAVGLFPNARGLLPTATPLRADGKGLGRRELGGDGLADAMVEGPPMRWLIDHGHLTDYRVVCVESHLDEFLGKVAESGDWSQAALKHASQESQIVGDVVTSYLQFGAGRLGITFTTDVETATQMANAYRMAGVPAEIITGDTGIHVRAQIIRRFERREIMQIIAVDVVSEGFDLPAIEVATFARPTASLAVYMQQFGRALRPLPGKDRAIIIDHVSNFLRHGPPDKPRIWTLESRSKRREADDAIPMRVCLNTTCASPFERFRKECPYCGTPVPPPDRRGPPEMVEGSMRWMDDDTLARLRGQIEDVDRTADEVRADLVAKHAPLVGVRAGVVRHDERQGAQAMLRACMADWGGAQRAAGLDDDEMQRLFWHRFGVDVLTAQTLGTRDAMELVDRIVKAV